MLLCVRSLLLDKRAQEALRSDSSFDDGIGLLCKFRFPTYIKQLVWYGENEVQAPPGMPQGQVEEEVVASSVIGGAQLVTCSIAPQAHSGIPLWCRVPWFGCVLQTSWAGVNLSQPKEKCNRENKVAEMQHREKGGSLPGQPTNVAKPE